jgi:archaeal flagellar protein FlaJ
MSKKEDKKTQDSYSFLRMFAIKLFGGLSDKFSDSFISLKDALVTSNSKILFRTYLSLTFLVTFLTYIITFFMTFFLVMSLRMDVLFMLFGLTIVPLFFASITFFIIFVYPFSVSQSRKRDIEANLPFALTHMAAVSESGAPPLTIFKILSKFKEYGEISKEANQIARNVELFGLDEISALKESSAKTSSSDFKDVLEGMIVTIQSGGSLKSYLIEESNKAMFEYTVMREKYNQLLSTYADIYTTLLIAAPMIFIVVLAALNIMGGTILGFTVEEFMVIGMLMLVTLNMVFLTFLSLSQPKA